MQSTSQKIIRNTKFNIVGRFWGILVYLLLTPFIIHHIGIERYGIWALITVLIGYFSLLDFGIGTSFVKFISEFYTKKENDKINQLINSGIVIYSILAVFIIAITPFIIDVILTLFNIPNELYKEAKFVFVLGIAISAIANALSPFRALQDGLQRMDIINKITILVSIPMAAGTLYVLKKGYGLEGLIINNAAVILLASAINVVVAFKIFPNLRFNPLLVNKSLMKKLFYFGVKIQINRLEVLFTFQADKVIIAHFLNISLVSFYEFGSMIINRTRELPLLLITSIIPAASEINAKKDNLKLYDLYIRGTKYLALIAMPLLTFVLITAPQIMLTWLGPGYGKSALVIQILAPCYFINILSGVGTSIGVGIGKPEMQVKAGLFQLILNITLSIILVIKIGFIGVVIATLLSLSLGSLWFIKLFHRHMGYSTREFAQKVLVSPLVASIPPGVILFTINSIIIKTSNRLENLILLALEAVVYLVIYVLIVIKIKYLDFYDISIIKDRIKSKKNKIHDST